jgi:hypothetical protein
MSGKRLGESYIRVLAFLLFWPALAGFILCVIGSGRKRLLGIGTSLVTGIWWLSLAVSAGISMGATLARHPIKFFIPEGYVGPAEIHYGDPNAPSMPLQNGTVICRIPESGILRTSSLIEDGWAKDEYFYYSATGSLRPLRETGRGQGGMIWNEEVSYKLEGNEKRPKEFLKSFYVGTEEKYRHNEKRPR